MPPRGDKTGANAYRRQKYAADPVYRQHKIDKAKARRAAIHALVDAYKLEHGCAACGFRAHAAALDLHHVGDKLFRIGGTLHAIEKVLAEIKKCKVLCANCHRIHHHEHGGHTR